MKVIIINWGGKNKFLNLTWWWNFPQRSDDKTESFDSLWSFGDELISLIPLSSDEKLHQMAIGMG